VPKEDHGQSSKKRKREEEETNTQVAPRRSSRAKKVSYREDNDDDEGDEYEPEEEDVPDFSMPIDEGADDEEEKPKMTMRLTYEGFTIYDRCLCLVVQPWPIVRASRASVTPARTPSVTPQDLRDRTPAPLQRERTPLFLPDLDPRRSVTPAPLPSRVLRNLPPVPLFHEEPAQEEIEEDDSDEDGGMMALSQALRAFRDERAGSADEDENEGEVFMGDADERKGDM